MARYANVMKISGNFAKLRQQMRKDADSKVLVLERPPPDDVVEANETLFKQSWGAPETLGPKDAKQLEDLLVELAAAG
jgi:hypothetical protein